MKKILFIFCLLVNSVAFAAGARTYYVSNAGNDNNNGVTTLTSFQTLSKVNGLTLNNGDSVLFNRGDVFYGSLTNGVNGVVFSSYGSGAKPIITGFVTITSWTNDGNNIWEAVVSNGLGSLSMVVMNGVEIAMGRYPNANASNGGYLTYKNYRPATPAIVDNSLLNTPNWTGADLVSRKQDYALTRNVVINHTDSVLTLNTSGQFAFRMPDGGTGLGYGYFFENSLQTLDQNGEWFYDSTTTKIKMYYTSPPPNIQVSTVATLINFGNTSSTGKSNIVIQNISLQGSESDLMYLSYWSNVLVDSCNFLFAGATGLKHRDMQNFTVQNCNFSDNNMTGIYEVNAGGTGAINGGGDSATLIRKNNFKRIGLLQGMGVKNNPNYAEGASSTAIGMGSQNMTIRENTIDSIGYCGILISKNRNYQIIRQNIISNYCSLKNDGGGIYNSGIRSDAMISIPVIIDSNIVFSSNDASNGTPYVSNPHCRGIYLDASSSKVNVYNNTIYSSYEGMYISQAQFINIKYNTIYGAGKYYQGSVSGSSRYASALNIFDANAGYQHTRYNVITNNTFFSDAPNKLFLFQTDRYNGVDSVGIIDSNYYASPMGDYPFSLVNTSDAVAPTSLWFKKWKQLHSVYDQHSTFSNVAIPPFTRSFTSVNRSTNSGFNSDVSNTVVTSTPTVHTFTWDNTSQLTGMGSARLTSSVKSNNYTQVRQIFGASDSTKKYILRFKTKATSIGTFQTYLQQWTGTYTIMTSVQTGSVDTAYQQHEILFSGEHSTQTNAALYINFSQDSSVTYIDDIEFYEATVTPNIMSDYTMLNVNKTNLPVNFALNSNVYNTLITNTSLNTVYSVPPFSASILFKGGLYAPPVSLFPIKLRYALKKN